MSTLLWILGGTFAVVLAIATWFSVDTIRIIRRGRRVQTDLNRDDR